MAFVRYSLPGEIVSARLLEKKKTYSRWLPTDIRRASSDRVDPPCPYHFKPSREKPWCGGCDWQHIAIGRQREAKRQFIVESLERIGGISDPAVAPTVASPEPWRYRNKVQVPFGGRPGHVRAGFYAPGSHEIVEFDDCLVQPEIGVRIVKTVKAFARGRGWAPYNEDAHKGWLRHLLVRTNRAGQALAAVVTASPAFPHRSEFIDTVRNACPEIIGLHQNVQPAKSHVILGRTWVPLWGQETIEETMLGLRLGYSPGAFFQINTAAAEVLYTTALSLLNPTPDSVVVDMYCGVGAMTLAAARRAKSAIGVEIAPVSVRDARANAERNVITNAEFLDMPSEAFFRRKYPALSTAKRVDVIVDPPRAGCEESLIVDLLRARPDRLVYVSCHPATFARDVKRLSPGYRLISVTPVDLFPQTSHVELAALLIRKGDR